MTCSRILHSLLIVFILATALEIALLSIITVSIYVYGRLKFGSSSHILMGKQSPSLEKK